jgi:hypothetical protein
MNSESLIIRHETQAKWICRAQVIMVHEDGAVVIEPEDSEGRQHVCDVLAPSEGSLLRLMPDDIVLAWIPAGQDQRGVVIGRIHSAQDRTTVSAEPLPDELVIEAKRNLTLRVGDGSITIRADGKILIKGKDLVSHAQRTNRIKGGSVAIN